MAADSLIQFDCPGCGTIVEADRSLAGMTACCGHCGEEIAVPAVINAAASSSPDFARLEPSVFGEVVSAFGWVIVFFACLFGFASSAESGGPHISTPAIIAGFGLILWGAIPARIVFQNRSKGGAIDAAAARVGRTAGHAAAKQFSPP